MLDVNKKTLHFDLTQRKHSHPSLLPLRMTLIAAESESPSRPPHIDDNEQCAVQLIHNMQAQYKKPHLFLNLAEIPSQHGFHTSLPKMAAIHV